MKKSSRNFFYTIIILALPIIIASSAPKELEKIDRIRVVGSSTAYPFTTIIAEEFSENYGYPTPIIESTGTGSGFNLFCTIANLDRPFMVNASRPIKPKELKLCQKNGIDKVKEIKIGYDGIIVSASVESKFKEINREVLFKALAKEVEIDGKLIENNYHTWSDIDPAMPNSRIEIYGPSTTSGTREVFDESVMVKSCLDNPAFIEKYPDLNVRKGECLQIREGGYFIQVGENDNLIIQKLITNKNALGVFGYNFLQQNTLRVKGLKIDGFEPNFENISNKDYPLSRPLFIYYNQDAFRYLEGSKDFLSEIVSDSAIGATGYLSLKGLVPLTEKELEEVQNYVLDSSN